MADPALSERQRFVLDLLVEEADTAPPAEDHGWRVPSRRLYAFQVQDALVKAGLAERPRTVGSSGAGGAANTLAALRRRGLVAKADDGVFIQARWWPTPDGARISAAIRTQGDQQCQS